MAWTAIQLIANPSGHPCETQRHPMSSEFGRTLGVSRCHELWPYPIRNLVACRLLWWGWGSQGQISRAEERHAATPKAAGFLAIAARGPRLPPRPPYATPNKMTVTRHAMRNNAMLPSELCGASLNKGSHPGRRLCL